MNVATDNVSFLYEIADEHAAAGRYEEAALAMRYAAQLTDRVNTPDDTEMCLIGYGDDL